MHLPLCNIEQISFGCDRGAGVRRANIERNHPGSWAVSELMLVSNDWIFLLNSVCVHLFIYFLNVMK